MCPLNHRSNLINFQFGISWSNIKQRIVIYRIRFALFGKHRKVKIKTKRSNSMSIVRKEDFTQVLNGSTNTLLLTMTWNTICLRLLLNEIEFHWMNYLYSEEMDTEMNKIAANEQIKQAENAIRIIAYDSILFILFFDYVRHKLIKISYDTTFSFFSFFQCWSSFVLTRSLSRRTSTLILQLQEHYSLTKCRAYKIHCELSTRVNNVNVWWWAYRN